MMDGPGGWDQVLKTFGDVVVKSPVATVALVLSTFFGYGISFVLFDYRRSQVLKSHYPFHVTFGLGFTAVVFSAVNYDLLSRNLTVDQITQRVPLTLLVGFAVTFVVIIAVAIFRELSTPYSREDVDAKRN